MTVMVHTYLARELLLLLSSSLADALLSK